MPAAALPATQASRWGGGCGGCSRSHLPCPALPPPQVERQITNQTYILRLHVTTQMAQLLFPPRGELEAAHQEAEVLREQVGAARGGE